MEARSAAAEPSEALLRLLFERGGGQLSLCIYGDVALGSSHCESSGGMQFVPFVVRRPPCFRAGGGRSAGSRCLVSATHCELLERLFLAHGDVRYES